MTATPADPEITELRELFKNLLDFRSLFQEYGIEEFPSSTGRMWSIWDLEYLYERCSELTLRQRQAITLCLVHNMREKDVAAVMGVKESNPVGMYATLGLRRLLDMIERGAFDRFRNSEVTPELRQARQVRALHDLASDIRTKIHVTPRHGCWLYPNRRSRQRTLVRIPSVYHSSGIALVDPLVVLYQAYIGPLPEHFTLVHPSGFGRSPLACVNYRHAELTITEEGKLRQATLLLRYQRSLNNGRAS